MDNLLIEKIDELIENSDVLLADDTITLINIKSVMGEPKPCAPFGEGPKKVLDKIIEMSQNEGFFTKDYNVGVISASLKEGQPDLGIWVHGDVVPEGTGWLYEPYRATVYKGCVIGRGATDNKGQFSAIFNLFKIFKKLGVELKYNPAIYVGSNEEKGMKDLIGIPDNPDAKGFLNVCTPPKLSLVPDGGFPVGYGGKGGMQMTFKSKTPVHGFTFTAGQDEAPGNANVIFENALNCENLEGCTIKKGEKTEIITFSPPRHGTNPDPNGNMITMMCSALLDNNLVAEEDRYILSFYKSVSLATDGAMFGIDIESYKMNKPLTLCTKKIDFKDGYPELTIDIRYPIEITFEEIVQKVTETADRNGFEIVYVNRGVNPYLLDPEGEILKLLKKASDEVTGEESEAFIMSGGTYAHRLPNAYVYGMSGYLPPEDFPKGHGGAHGIDEAVSIARLKRAMKIYARAMLWLNEIDW